MSVLGLYGDSWYFLTTKVRCSLFQYFC